MIAEIISCGTELLLGHNVDTNSAYLSNVLSSIGIDVFRHTTIGDNKERLNAAISDALSKSDIVITTGGLGPTIDDITIGTISSVVNRDLVFNKTILKNIKEYFKRHGSGLPKSAIKQALIPRESEWLANSVGTAPGLIIKHEKKYIIALPGPPRELIPMVKEKLMPYLKKLCKESYTIKSRSIKLIGLPEAKVNEEVADLLEMGGNATVGIYTNLGEVVLRITVKAKTGKLADGKITKLEKKIKKAFGPLVYGTDEETLQEVVGRRLLKSKKTLAIAESCTGGQISSLITDTPGSSHYLKAGLVAYSNDIKTGYLKVDKALIKKDGAVNKKVAKSMADNVREFAGADIGLGITGIAGPAGGTKKKPVGLVYIVLSSKKKNIAKEFKFSGTREEIKLQSAQQALNMLRLNL